MNNISQSLTHCLDASKGLLSGTAIGYFAYDTIFCLQDEELEDFRESRGGRAEE